MLIDRRTLVAGTAAGIAAPAAAAAGPKADLIVDTPMAAPEWAVLQRQLLTANADACEQFYRTYVDQRDWLKVFERWGANDGPDDAAEATNDWVTIHALGGSPRLLTLAKRFYEGHVRQYTAAKTVDVPIARHGMYSREFPVQMDWQHNSEGLTTFNVMGLSDPRNRKLLERTRRFADLYTGRDPIAHNYDPAARIVRSVMNGSRGPMLRPATPLDWAGDPFDTSRFRMDHGENSYAQTLLHYAEYGEVVGDNPLNLQSTTLGLNAYALGGGERYRKWALDYLGAWAERARANHGILPSFVGSDGKVGANWWRGVYGWGFSPVVPQTGKREDRNRVPRSITAFYNALLLSGDMRFIELWRRQNERINEQGKSAAGTFSTPTMFGEKGWYGWKAGPYRTNGFEIWYATQSPVDRERAGDHPWIAFLEGRNAAYPEQALRKDLKNIADRRTMIAEDRSTRDTRLADWPLDKNPATATALVQLMTGGMHIGRPTWTATSPNQGGVPLHCRLRYFDAEQRRAGVPEGVAALVHGMSDNSTEVTLVNLGGVPRTVIVQGGGYGEHRIDTVTTGRGPKSIRARHFAVRLQPGCGARLAVGMSRYANRPSLAFPWSA